MSQIILSPVAKNTFPKDLAGLRFGMLKAVRKVDVTKHGVSRWLCICDCGRDSVVQRGHLTLQETKSCGCAKGRLVSSKITKHGLHSTPEYRSWSAMRNRCLSETDHAYKNYGGRGITVCADWVNDVLKFVKDMGLKPSPVHSLDRIDNSKGYFPENCRWATDAEQVRNRRVSVNITHDGLTLCETDWSLKLGGLPGIVRKRIKRGWSIADACSLPAGSSL